MCIEGTQGYISKVKVKLDENSEIDALIKSSKYIDYTIELEYEMIKKLEILNMPHFVKMFGLSENNLILKFVSFLDEPKPKSLSDFIKTYEFEISRNLIYNTLLACVCMHKHLKMSHNDLHSSNVLIEKTDYDAYIVYNDSKLVEFEKGMKKVSKNI
jgi:hypothetical protein